MNTVRVGKNDYSLFQKYCEKAIGQISKECIEKFNETKDEDSRIQLLYEAATKIPISITELNGKNLQISSEEKTKGNAYFAKKDYTNALKSYNNGIIKCPQNSDDSRELLSILISNRSATYFALNEYRKVFDDIDYLLEVGYYPAHLKYKVWIRKAKCYDALQNEKSASEAYDEALNSLNFSKLDEKSIKTKTQEIEKARQTKINAVPPLHEIVLAEEPEIFVGGKEYLAAHPKISFEQDTYQGRYAVANGDIEIGTIIVEENAHGAVVDRNHALYNCQHCFSSVEQPIACPTCANVVFCSTICERLANRSYHKIECPVQETLFESGASVNCLLALRLITQKHYSFFNDKKNKLQKYLRDDCKENVIKKKIYKYDDYDNVFFLCRNENLRKKEELVHFSCMSIYLLRLLKFGKFFPFATDDGVLREEEVYFGSLILRHLQILQFNAHEVSELKNLPDSCAENFMNTYENDMIGAGLYPTLALFNHSCDPSIVRYNLKSKMVVRTVKPVKTGDIIYENYGPLYTTMQLKQRQVSLKNSYWFECLCTPCVGMWPMFAEMVDNEIRIPCKTEKCPYVFVMGVEGDPFFTCEYCNVINSVLPNIRGLMVLDTILPEAESMFAEKQLNSALKKFIQGLNILFKYTKPPHPEIIKVQQRIRNCMIHMGNKTYNYKL